MTIQVPSVDDMENDVFELHMNLRHPLVRFQTRGEHEADHRIHKTRLHEHLAPSVQKYEEQK